MFTIRISYLNCEEAKNKYSIYTFILLSGLHFLQHLNGNNEDHGLDHYSGSTFIVRNGSAFSQNQELKLALMTIVFFIFGIISLEWEKY